MPFKCFWNYQLYIQWWFKAFSFCFTTQQSCLCSQTLGWIELTLSGWRQDHLLISPPCCTLFPFFHHLLLHIFVTCEHLFVCARVTNCACVSACAYTLSARHGARNREITSWRKHYSIAFSIQITQMFIATSATTGGEGWTFGRLAGLALHGAVVFDASWQQVKKNWLTWECHI